MADTPSVRPTGAELEILRVLWHRGPSTVREVHDRITEKRGITYTTVLKLLQIMTEKGLVRRDDSQRSHRYSARFTEARTQRQLLRDLLERAFGGSMPKLVLQALATKRASREDLAQIRRLLDDLEGGKHEPD